MDQSSGRKSYKKKKNPSIHQKRNTIRNRKIPKRRKNRNSTRAKGIYGRLHPRQIKKIEKDCKKSKRCEETECLPKKWQD